MNCKLFLEITKEVISYDGVDFNMSHSSTFSKINILSQNFTKNKRSIHTNDTKIKRENFIYIDFELLPQKKN